MNKNIVDKLSSILNYVDSKKPFKNEKMCFFSVVVTLQSMNDTITEDEALKYLDDYFKDLQQIL